MANIIKDLINRITAKKREETPIITSSFSSDEVSEYNPEYVIISQPDNNKQKCKLYYYDEYVDADLYGGRNKQFYRCESTFFEPLFKELQTNPNCNYFTAYNDLIKEGYIPETLSVLRYDDDTTYDIFNSRLLNYFKAPTVYTAKCRNEKGNFSLMSVDFISKNEEFRTLYESMGIVCSTTENLLGCVEKAYTDFRKKTGQSTKPKDPNFRAELNQLKEEFVKQKLISRYIIGETDGSSYNFGTLENVVDKKFRLAPLFDIENISICNEFFYNQDDLQFIYTNYPKVFKEVIDMAIEGCKIDPITNQTNYFNAITSEHEDDKTKTLKKGAAAIYQKNTEVLLEHYNELTNTAAHEDNTM